MPAHRETRSRRSESPRLNDGVPPGAPNSSRSVSRIGSVNGSIARPGPRSGRSLFTAISPTSPSKRFTLLEAVEEVTETGLLEEVERNSHQRIPHVQAEGAKLLREFQSQSETLSKDLQKFQEAVQVLGSSSDLARAAGAVCECLSVTSWLFQENARKLFPLAVKFSEPPQMEAEYDPEQKRRPRWPPAPGSQSKISYNVPMVSIYAELKVLADSVGNLSGELEQFPEFDNFGKQPLRYFEGDLKFWSSSLGDYEGQFESPEVQAYVHDLSIELGQHFEDTSRCIIQYIACVPTVRVSQKHAMSNLQTMATIATFFSAVTATTIQYTIGNIQPGFLFHAANAFWFSSLVFSIASALYSSLALMWRSARYSSPQHRIPSWLRFWIRQCPTVFLLISVVTFLAGLGCFAGASQPRVIWVIVLICEGVSSFSLAALLLWLAADKWRLQLERHSSFRLNQIWGRKNRSVLPTHFEHTYSWSVGHLDRAVQTLSLVAARFKLPTRRRSSTSVVLKPLPGDYTRQSPPGVPKPPSSLSTARLRWDRAIKKVIVLSRLTHTDDLELDILEAERVTRLQLYLRKLSGPEEEIRHEAGAATSGLQFNPEGSSLAVCGRFLSIHCEVGSSEKSPLHLRHYTGQAQQVIWTTSGDYLLTRTNRAVHVWARSREIGRKTIIRHETTGFILGIPNIKSLPSTAPMFISVEGSSMSKLVLIDVRGVEHRDFDFDNLSIQHADVVSDGPCMLLVAEVFRAPNELKTMRAAPARKLIVFNLESRQVEHQVPLWHNVQSVTVSSDGRMAIVTYKGYPPPQLWRLRKTLHGIELSMERQFCAREQVSAHEFDPSKQIQFSGEGHFSNHDLFVLCTSTEGKIHFWRRDRSDPVYVFGGLMAEEKDKPIQVACNRASEDFMFATRSQDGTVRIWKAQDAPPIVTRVDMTGLQGSMTGDATPHMLSESPIAKESEEPEGGTEGDQEGATPQQTMF